MTSPSIHNTDGQIDRGTKLRPLDIALRVLLRVDEGAYATLALSGELSKQSLPESDRSLITELTYGTLRQVRRVDRALVAHAPRGLEKLDATTRALLRLGAYQLLFMQAQPHFVVDAVVTQIKKRRGAGLAGFANAVLRKLVQTGEPALPPYPSDGEHVSQDKWCKLLALHHSMPDALVEQFWQVIPNPQELDALLRSLSQPAPTWLRLNPLRATRDDALVALRSELAQAPLLHPIVPEAVELRGGHPFSGPGFAKGFFTAQDLAAQLTTRLLFASTPSGPLKLPDGAILDGCAGVGGKTCHLSSLTENQREIDAVDRLPRKLELLRDHAHRLGCKRIRTICGDFLDVETPLRQAYAAVLLDAPCSGSGVLRRHPEARLRPPNLAELSGLQARLLDRAAQLVAPGGVLLYSVCSLFVPEGPAQIASFLARHPDFSPLPPASDDPIFSSNLTPLCEPKPPFALRTLPHRDNADGFYAVRLLHTCTSGPTE